MSHGWDLLTQLGKQDFHEIWWKRQRAPFHAETSTLSHSSACYITAFFLSFSPQTFEVFLCPVKLHLSAQPTPIVIAILLTRQGENMGKFSAIVLIFLAAGLMECCVAQAPAGSATASPVQPPSILPISPVPADAPSSSPPQGGGVPAPSVSALGPTSSTPGEGPAPSPQHSGSSGRGVHNIDIFRVVLLGGAAFLL